MKTTQIKPTGITQSAGFTLIELLMVLAVSSILLSTGIPAYMNLVNGSKVSAASSELYTVLNLAKTEAIRSGRNVILCKSDNGENCANNATPWSKGWLLFRDENNNHTKDDDETIIRSHAEFESTLNFTFKTANYIRFNTLGRSNVNGRFCFENQYSPNNSRAIIVTQPGRIRIEKRNSANNCEA